MERPSLRRMGNSSEMGRCRRALTVSLREDMGLVIGEDAVPHALVRRHAEHFQKGGTPAQEGGLRIDPELGNPARQRVVERPLLGGMPQGCLGLVLGAAGEQDAVRPAYGGGEGQQGENGMALAAIGLLQVQLQRGERGRKDVTQLLRRENCSNMGIRLEETWLHKNVRSSAKEPFWPDRQGGQA